MSRSTLGYTKTRAEYLSAIGVQPWFAKVRLPQARTSPIFELIEDANEFEAQPDAKEPVAKKEDASTVTSKTPLDNKPRLAAALNLGAKPEDSHKLPHAAGSKDLTLETGSISEGGASIGCDLLPSEFQFNCYKFDEALVLSDCEDVSLLTKEHQLVNAILTAYYSQEVVGSLDSSLVWPVFSIMPDQTTHTGEQGLASIVLGQYLQNIVKQRSSTLFIFSRRIPVDLLLNMIASSKANAFKNIVTSQVTPVECLKDARCKAQLWADLVRQRDE